MIQTTQDQFESEIRASHTVTLDELNRYFQAWLHAGYHQTEHSATSQTPHQRFHEQTRFRRHVNMSEALEFFHIRQKRKVDDEYCDVRIDKCFFAVDLKYRGDWVLVTYDPFSRIQEVRLYSLEGQFLQVAPRYERERGTHPFADAANQKATEETPLDHEYLKMLEERHRQQQQHESQKGLDYYRAHHAHVLSLAQFTAKFARLLGRKGGASGLSTRELELLGKVHRHHPRITALLLERAFERAEPKTIPVIVFHLQNLLSP